MKMKGKMRRIGAAILAFVLVATMSQWPTMVNAADSEGVVTIPDAGFESGVNNWTLDGSGELKQESEVSHSGAYCAIIEPSAIFASGASFSMTLKAAISVTKGKTYTYGAYVALSGGTNQSVSVKLLDDVGNVLNEKSTVVTTKDNEHSEWTLVQGCFTPQVDNVKLQFYYQSSDEGTIVNDSCATIDDVFITLANEDFELVRSDMPEGWNSSSATLSLDTSTYHKGTQSLHVAKDNLEEKTQVDATALYELSREGVTSDYQIKWGMWHSSKNSDAFARLDAVFFDENFQKLESVDGMRAMLSREDVYSAWDEVATVVTIPYEARYVAFSIVLSSGNVDAYFDDIFWSVYEEEERVADSSVTGWSAQEVWYPENEKTDGSWQFRYFRTEVNLSKPIEGDLLYLQVSADDSTGAYVNGNYVWGAIYVDGNLCTPAYTTWRESKVTYTYEISTSSLTDKQNIVIATRVLNCNSYAGYTMQGFAIMNLSDLGQFNYETIFKTEASNTVSSKLGCTEPMDENNYNEFATWAETGDNANWYQTDYNDSSWVAVEERGMVPYGNMGDVPFDWKHSNAFFIYDTGNAGSGHDVSGKAGEKVTLNVTGAYTDLYGFTYDFGKPDTPSTVKALIYDAAQYTDTDKTKLNVLATIDVSIVWDTNQNNKFSFVIPDYLPAGTYKMVLTQMRDQNGVNRDNIFASLNITEPSGTAVSTSKVITENGAVRLKINDKIVSPVMYLRPSEMGYYNYSSMSNFENTGVSIYSTYNGFLDGKDGSPIWTAADTIDYDAFDKDIYQTLNLNPKAMVMVNINLDAPDWWLDANEDQKIKLADGSILNEVSFASTKYRDDASKVVTRLVDHMIKASYKHRIAGVKLTAGRTYEWMNFTQSDDGYVYTLDYSEPMKTAFGGTLPTIDERLSGENGVLLNPSNQSAVIKYNKVLSQCVTDSLLTYAKAVKDVNANWIVGAYNGYLWNEGSAAGIGATHTTTEQVLDSSYIDFISSPISYSERISGYGTGYMSLSESIAAHGKLYMLEQDNRTLYGKVFSNADAEGATYSVEETMQQLVRDTATDLVEGNGLWYFDMQGGWYDHDAIEACIKELKAEYDYSLGMDNSTNSQVAVFVGSETYNYLADDTLDNDAETNDSYKLMGQLYNAQRVELSKMGTSYDTYMIEDLTSSNVTTDWSQYKLNIILSPFELSEAERTAIADKLQKNGNYVLWIYLPGVSDGSAMNATNIQNTTGMSVTLNTAETTLEAKISNDNFGVVDDCYGASYTYKTPYVVIGADGVTELATYTNGNGIAAAMKDCGTYTSVYSAVPNVPADALRDLCVAAGVHIYAEDKDVVVETNASYVTVHSQVAGDIDVTLPENEWGYKVYDVLNKTDVTVTDCSFTAALSNAGDTGLYRITPMDAIEIANKDWNGVLIKNANFADWSGEVPVGYALGNDVILQKSIDVEKGYIATINGKADYQIFEYPVEVEAGKSYEFTFCSKSTGTTGKVCQILGSDWSPIYSGAEVWVTANTNGTWENITYTFDATVSEKIYLHWLMFGGEDNSWSLTNLRLQVVGDDELIPNGTFIDENVNCDTGYFGWYKMQYATTTKGPNLIVNSSFEEDLTSSWIVAEKEGITVSTSNDYAASGSSSVKVSSDVIGLYDQPQQIVSNVEPNTEYTISWKVLIDSTDALGNVYAFPFVYEFNENATAVTGQHALDGTTAAGHSYGNWLEFTRTITTAENTRVLRIDLWNNFASNTGCVYWDNIMVYASNVNCATVDTMSIQKSSLTGISGLDITGNGCGIQANTTRATVKDATYILKYNAALSGSGDTKLIMYKEVLDDEGVLTGYDERLQESISLTKEANTVKMLFASQDSGKYLVRFAMLETANTTKLSLGNISMKLNRGDFDENNGGYPDSADFVEMRKAMIDHEEATEDAKTFAEMNADGVVNSKDLVRMKLYEARMK